MTARRTDTHRIQELIRLHRLGESSRSIARRLQMSRDAIRAYRRALSSAGLLDGAAEVVPDLELVRETLAEQLPSRPPPQQVSSVDAWSELIAEMYGRHASPTAIFDRLRLEHPNFPGSLSAVKRLCARIRRERGIAPDEVAIPVETEAGHIAQVDFTYVGKLYDPEQGVLRKCWLFLMSLGHSRHMYCQLVFDQKVETWVRLHVEAFESFGGVPRVIVPDNLKAAVIRAAFAADDDPAIQRTYRELARHYGFQIDPAPPRSPEKKGKVEANAKYVKRNFLGPREPDDVVRARVDLQLWVREIAGLRIHGTTGRRPLEVFEAEERAGLLPLPSSRYEIVLWKQAQLHRDCHVQIDGGFYSAPWRLVGQHLWACCTKKSVTLYHGDERLWVHSRVPRGKRSTVDAHLPEGRRDLRHRSSEHWLERAKDIGPETLLLVQEVFASDDVLLRLRAVQAIVTHLGKHPKERAEAAAARARHFGSRSYVALKNILRQGLDLEPLVQESRRWSKGSRFARHPHDFKEANQETLYGNNR
ncbi:MAG: IS21 family transposase [Longimicrobiales bacterium]